MQAIGVLTAVAATVWLCTSAAAETREERNACFSDAFRVCWSEVLNRDAVYHCLWKNRRRLSDACRVVMNNHPPQQVARHSVRGRHVSETTGSGGRGE